MKPAKKFIPEGYHTVTPQLILDNAAQAIDWYKKALGAEEISRMPTPDGKSCTRKCASATRASC